MAIGLTQTDMNSFAAEMLALLPSECVTYKTMTGADVEVFGHFLEFTAYQKTIDPMLRTKRRFRMATDAIAGTPIRTATLVRGDGSVYDVDQVDGGLGRPFWFLEVRQVR